MRKRSQRRSDCPVSFALDNFGDKWSLLIIRDLMFSGKSSYGEFLKSDEAMATNILADRLCTLENAGIIEKSQNKEDKRKDIYKLTAKGIDLLPVLIEIILWSAKYDPKTGASKDLVINAKNDRVKLINHIKTTLR